MTSKKICVVVGTRPEAIKMAPVILEFQKFPEKFDVTVCCTGQHSSMLRSALSSFGIQADIDLNVMKAGQTLSELTSRLLVALDTFLSANRPDLILVHGDTTSAMVGAISGFYHRIDVGHVEAGLRTQNLNSPFPEEYNRSVIAVSAKYHFAPTENAKLNLQKCGVEARSVIITGNTVIDALLTIKDLLEKDSLQSGKIHDHLNQELGYDLTSKPYILVTAHRRENFGIGVENVCSSIAQLAQKNLNFNFIYPVHLNPNIKTVVDKKLNNIQNVSLIAPQDYMHFCYLLDKCYLVLTDSGGIQEEAPALGKPVLVMRDTSERPEAIQAGTAKLVTNDKENIVKETQLLIDSQEDYLSMSQASNPFGDGTAAQKIVSYLDQTL